MRQWPHVLSRYTSRSVTWISWKRGEQNRKQHYRALVNQPSHAVLATDASITHHPQVQLFRYVRNGGTLTLMGPLTDQAKQPWRPVPTSRPTLGACGLPTHHSPPQQIKWSITAKFAILLLQSKSCISRNAPVEDASYLPKDASRTESPIFSSERTQNLQQTPIAFTSMDNGKMGYVGDVNGKECSDAVVLAMCGLWRVWRRVSVRTMGGVLPC